MLAALTIIGLRNIFPDIKLIMVLPGENQDKYWLPKDKILYKAVKASANKIVFTSEDYYAGCMHVRNRYLLIIVTFVFVI